MGNGFTSLPKEGVLRIFSPWKIRRLRPGLNPRTWVPKASTLPLDHRSRYSCLTAQHIPGNLSCTSNLLYNCVSGAETEQRRKRCGSVIHMRDFRLPPLFRCVLHSSGVSRSVESQKTADLRMIHTMRSGRYGQSCVFVQHYSVAVHVAYCCCPSTSKDVRCDAK